MKAFTDAEGREWVATAVKEDTPRHHGIWFLVFHPQGDASARFAVPEVRWQTAATGERTLRTMSDFELRRRLKSALARYGGSDGEGHVHRARTSINAG